MANVDHIKVGSTSYDISPSPTGTLTTGTGGFSSSDTAQASATAWTSVNQITTSDNHASIFTKITQMAKNVRYLYNVLGTGFSTSSTVKSQIDGKAASSHSHKVAQLPTSSTQVNSNDYIPTSALIYSMNQTLTSLNDASLKSTDKVIEISANHTSGYLEITDTNKNILTAQFKSISIPGVVVDNMPNLKSIYIIAPLYIPSLNIGNKYYGIKVILDYAYSKDLSVIVSVIYY